jgi:hypothetical protein
MNETMDFAQGAFFSTYAYTVIWKVAVIFLSLFSVRSIRAWLGGESAWEGIILAFPADQVGGTYHPYGDHYQGHRNYSLHRSLCGWKYFWIGRASDGVHEYIQCLWTLFNRHRSNGVLSGPCIAVA